MSTDAMELDPSEGHTMQQKAETLHRLATGQLSSSLSKLLGSSRDISSNKDFHFYHNFNDFKVPITEIAEKSKIMLDTIGSSSAHLWGKEMDFPEDLDEAYGWLVNINDQVYERFDASTDEFQRLREQEENGVKEELVSGMKNEGHGQLLDIAGDQEDHSPPAKKLVSKDTKITLTKAKVPFHIPSITRPQDEYKIVVNNSNQPFNHVWLQRGDGDLTFMHPQALISVKQRNRCSMEKGGYEGPNHLGFNVFSSATNVEIKWKFPYHIPSIPKPQEEFKIRVNNVNQPFEHVWLQRSEDGRKVMHPQEKFSFADFVDKDIENVQPVKPPPIEDTPFKIVEDVKDLKLLAAKLRVATEFAVDLEHNQYRSFQGLTCLMQISTRTEDFVVDTLKLRIQIGPYLREVFKDPTKRKVLHGANNDIFWLQRDFGIYVCNMFDTGQASRVLKLERFSLEYLLSHLCGVTANKEYQNGDWRLRPLPQEMIKYAREDTHYLLYIYDLLRIRLHSAPSESESESDLLAEVYKRSYDLCMQLYEKELLTDTSYLHIYGLQNADFNAQRLAIVAGLCQWRDSIARTEDESTGYILPNKTVLEIAKEMPFTINNLKRVLKSKHPYVERNLSAVVSIIRHSVQNYSSFEAAAQQLKEKRLAEAEKKLSMDSVSQPLPVESNANNTTPSDAYYSKLESLFSDPPEKETSPSFITIGQVRISEPPGGIGFKRESLAVAGEVRGNSMSGEVVQAQKKSISALGAMLGSSSTKREFVLDKKEKEEIKLEQTKSSKNISSHPLPDKIDQLPDESELIKEPFVTPTITSESNEIICLDSDTDIEETEVDEHLDEEHGKASSLKFDNDIICLDSDSETEENVAVVDATENKEQLPGLEMVNGGEQQIEILSSALSSSFQDCLESDNKNGKTRGAS